MRKQISLVLSVCILLVSVLSVPFSISAESTAIEFETVTNTYDETNVTYSDTDSGVGTNRTVGDSTIQLSNYQAKVETDTADSANKALHFYGSVKNSNSSSHRWPNAANIYDSNETNAFFTPTVGTTYKISFKYRSDTTPDKELRVFVAYNGLADGTKWDDGIYYRYVNAVSITAATEDWTTVETTFTATSSNPLMLKLNTNNASWWASNVDLWIDDITVTQISADLVCHNYDGMNDSNLSITAETTIAELTVPTRSGYTFAGFYGDAALSDKAEDNELASNYSELWVKWEKSLIETIVNTYDEDGAVFEGDTTTSFTAGEASATQITYKGLVATEDETTGNKAVNFNTGSNNTSWNVTSYTSTSPKIKYPYIIRIYDPAGGAFKAEYGVTYKLTLKYKTTVDMTYDMRFFVGETNGGKDAIGQYNPYYHELSLFDSVVSKTATNEWVEVTTEFTPRNDYANDGDDATENYVVVGAYNVAGTSSWNTSLNLYVDDITVTPMYEIPCYNYNGEDAMLSADNTTTFADIEIPYRSGYKFCGFYMDEEYVAAFSKTDKVAAAEAVYAKWEEVTVYTNSYDETDVEFTKLPEGDFNNTNISVNGVASSKNLSQYAWVDSTTNNDGNNTNAMKVTRIYRRGWTWPTAFKIYDPNYENYPAFVPKTNTSYTITLKYKVDKLQGKGAYLVLRHTAGEENMSVAEASLDSYNYGDITNGGIPADTVTDGWTTAEFNFTTGESVSALFIAAISSDSGYLPDGNGNGVELYVDDIVISESKEVTIYNYMANGKNNEKIYVGVGKIYGDLSVPEMSGATFGGYFADEALTIPVDTSAVIESNTEIWTKWIYDGDINIDSVINLRDLVKLKKIAVYLEEETVSADINKDGKVDSADLTEMRQILLDETVTFELFADFHYKESMYISSIADMEEILARANNSNADFIIQAGDFSNDFIGSPELMNAYLNNSYNLPAYGIYGNHELESENNSMQVVTPLLNNRSDEVVWGTEDGKIGDGSIGYYYFDKGNLRVVCTDTNYSWNPNEEIWEHNVTNSIGAPDAAYNQERYGDENAVANTNQNSLGPVQLAWLEEVLTDAANNGKKVIVFGHATFNENWDDYSSDAAAVAELYAKANAVKANTVIMSINGHYHTNRTQIVDGVFFFDVNTVRNGAWKGGQTTQHYTSDQTVQKVSYNEDGSVASTADVAITSFWQAKNTWFYENPLSTTVTISLNTGKITINGMTTDWIFDVDPGINKSYVTPEITGTISDLW